MHNDEIRFHQQNANDAKANPYSINVTNSW